MTGDKGPLEFDRDRLADLMKVLEQMAAGDTDKRLTISANHDELDAIAHGINVLVGELGWTTARVLEAQMERAAAAERADASKSIFLRNMSHEIRTPIAAMLGFADLLLAADLLKPPRLDLLRRLQANGLAVLSLLDDLLDLARLDAGKIVLTPEPVSIVELVRDVLASVEIDSRAKDLEMRVDATGDAFGTVVTDRYRLRQILLNLVANAVKFTEAGSVTVGLRVKRGAGLDQWTIDVADTGIGIAEDRHAHLFEPFEQANASISRVYGGNGLGLALSRKLAEQLGGTLTLDRSRPGEGAIFRLILSAFPATGTPRADAAAPAGDTAGMTGLHILLAEDHRDLHMALREILEEAGAVVSSAYDGRDVMARTAASAFDVVLMDLRMPQMDGLEATRALRRQGFSGLIVALTADPATLRRAEALDAGCDGCLSKPFKLDDVVALITRSPRLKASG